jgi:hypothetical protein
LAKSAPFSVALCNDRDLLEVGVSGEIGDAIDMEVLSVRPERDGVVAYVDTEEMDSLWPCALGVGVATHW